MRRYADSESPTSGEIGSSNQKLEKTKKANYGLHWKHVTLQDASYGVGSMREVGQLETLIQNHQLPVKSANPIKS